MLLQTSKAFEDSLTFFFVEGATAGLSSSASSKNPAKRGTGQASSGTQMTNRTLSTPDGKQESFENHYWTLGPVLVLLFLFAQACIFVGAGHALALEEGYKQYKDPRQRFTFDYPGTMQVTTTSADEVKISHPKATLRIRLVVEERPKKPIPTAAALLETMKKNLKKELNASILEEGTLPGLKGAQGYVICFFKDRRNMELVQLLQYYVTEDRLLQMIISDRPEGFKNLQKVIRHIHQSLRITKTDLK